MQTSIRTIMQHAIPRNTSSFITTSATIKYPTRIITYGWGERYVDILLTFTLPALLAPGNLPYVASEVASELVILPQHRFFPTFNRHPVIARPTMPARISSRRFRRRIDSAAVVRRG